MNTAITEIKLQYQLSNGQWVDCRRADGDRTEEFLLRCEQFNGVASTGKIVAAFRSVRLLTRDEVIAALLTGLELRNDKNDWYSVCRSGSAYETAMAASRAATPPAVMVKCSCGHAVPNTFVMFASLGSSCPDCYDRMSG